MVRAGSRYDGGIRVAGEIAHPRGRPRGLLDRFAKGSQQGRAWVAFDGRTIARDAVGALDARNLLLRPLDCLLNYHFRLRRGCRRYQSHVDPRGACIRDNVGLVSALDHSKGDGRGAQLCMVRQRLDAAADMADCLRRCVARLL